MDKLTKVRAEVERLHNEYRNKKGALYFRKALRTVLFIIDSMPEESVSEDMEKAARMYAGIPEDSPHDLKYSVQDKKAKYDAVLYGANLQKQQMMKNSVEGIVREDSNGYLYVYAAVYRYNGFSRLDKVKAIIIKED